MMPTLEVNVDTLQQITVRHSLQTIITTDIQSKNITIAAVLYFPKTSFDLCHFSLDSPFSSLRNIPHENQINDKPDVASCLYIALYFCNIFLISLQYFGME